MVATGEDCIADKGMRSDARRLTLRLCLTQNPTNESVRDGFLGRRKGVPSAVGVRSPHPSKPKPAARDRQPRPFSWCGVGRRPMAVYIAYAPRRESLLPGDAPAQKR